MVPCNFYFDTFLGGFIVWKLGTSDEMSIEIREITELVSLNINDNVLLVFLESDGSVDNLLVVNIWIAGLLVKFYSSEINVNILGESTENLIEMSD